MCKKQTSVSHSSTESEIISLDAGLRMDGLLALDLCDMVIEVLRSTRKQITNQSRSIWKRIRDNCLRNTPKLKQKGNRDADQWSYVDHVPTHAQLGLSCTFLKIAKRWSKCDHQRQKSIDETCVKNPQGCAWFVVWQNWFGPQDPNQICWHQNPTCWHVNQRKFHAWWVEPSSSFVEHHGFLNLLL